MKSLYFRVFLITIATVIISSLLGFLASNTYYHLKLKPYNDDKLIRMANTMKDYVEAHPEQMAPYLANVAALGYEIDLTDASGKDQFYGHAFREKDLAPADLKRVLAGERYHGVANFPNKPFITGFFDNRLSNTVGIPLLVEGNRYALFVRPDVLLQFGELRIFFALVGALTVGFSVLFFLFSTRYLVKPITRLTEATKRIVQGQYNLALPEHRRDEIGQLAHHFMVMSRDLERVEQARQQFVANVSHEIQTPLTSIQGFAQTLSEQELSAEERARYARIIAEESGHLSRLSKQLLTLSALEQSAEGLNKRAIPLRSHLRQIVQVLEWQLTEKMLALTIVVPDTLVIQGDEVLLSQVWMNLLSNAVKHTPDGGGIEVRAVQLRDQVEIRISDTGQGIPEAHLPFLFDRFYRVDRSRDRATGGTGLGLSIVKKIVQLHGGVIEVKSREGQGTTVTVTLPLL